MGWKPAFQRIVIQICDGGIKEQTNCLCR
jgi:hypothetical protein